MTRIVCFGDSITRAAEFAEQHRWPNLVKAALDAWRPGAFQVYNRGVNGNTTAQALDRFDADVRSLLPAVVLVQFGFNDANVRDWSAIARVSLAEYRRNLHEFHRCIIEGGGCCIFIVNHTVAGVTGLQGNGACYEDNFAPYNATLRELAGELDAQTVDLPQRMSERAIETARFLGADGLHLSAPGNHSYAEIVVESVRRLLDADAAPVPAATRPRNPTAA